MPLAAIALLVVADILFHVAASQLLRGGPGRMWWHGAGALCRWLLAELSLSATIAPSSYQVALLCF